MGFASFGVFVISLGAGIISYSLLNTPTSLKEFREGTESYSRASAGLAAFGCGIMVFATGYVTAALRLGFSSRLYDVLWVLLPLSMALIVSSLLKRAKYRVRVDETEISASARQTVGRTILLTGFALQAVILGYGHWISPEFVIFGVAWSFYITPLIVIAGLAILWGPMGMPWIPGGYGKQDADDDKS